MPTKATNGELAEALRLIREAREEAHKDLQAISKKVDELIAAKAAAENSHGTST